jgi:hypothetical protein
MDRVMSKVMERLAEQSSRGGFMATLGKVTLGLATVLLTGAGLADEVDAAASIKCCSGTPCSSTPGYTGVNGCPAAYGGCCVKVGYTWQCGGQGQGNPHYCHDCYAYPASSTCPNNPTNGGFYCTYVDTSPTGTMAC